jgi:hypothetical protein
MNNGSRFSCCFRVLMVVCFLGCLLALPTGAVLTPGRVILVTLDPCANQQPVADFSASQVSLNPPQIVLNDKSTCANQWQWIVKNPTYSYDYQSSTKGPSDKNIVVTLPSPGVYTVMLRVGRNCPGCPEGTKANLMHCCVFNVGYSIYGEKTQDVTVTASPTTPPTTPVTTPATQPPQSLPTTISPPATTTQQTQQQSATSAAPSQTSAPAAFTSFAPATPGQGFVTSGAISITTSPPGAEVWIDNEMKGASPAVISALSPGTHALALRKTGYQNISTTFIIESGQTREYSTGLIPTAKSPGFSAFAGIGGVFILFFARKVFR